MDNNDSIEAKINLINSKLDQIKSRCVSQTQRLDKDLNRREESIRQDIRITERELIRKMENHVLEIEGMLDSQSIKYENQYSNFLLNVDQINIKISQMHGSSDQLKSFRSNDKYVQQEEMEQTNIRIKYIEERIDQLISDNFHITGLVGPYEKYDSFRNYCFQSHESFTKRILALETQIKNTLSANLLERMKQEFSDN